MLLSVLCTLVSVRGEMSGFGRCCGVPRGRTSRHLHSHVYMLRGWCIDCAIIENSVIANCVGESVPHHVLL